MAISKDLFMAILSMDSCNHGKNAGIEGSVSGSNEKAGAVLETCSMKGTTT